MYCYSGGARTWAQYLAKTIELKIILGGVIFAYEEDEPITEIVIDEEKREGLE
jgi:hypothetical protein